MEKALTTLFGLDNSSAELVEVYSGLINKVLTDLKPIKA
jgi:hypothetical protein